MKLLIRDHIAAASHSLRINRTRSVLTALGIAIGIASVTAILALAEGVTRSVGRQVDEIGGNVAVVRPGALDESGVSPLNPLTPQGFATSSLTPEDVDRIRKVHDGLTVAPIMTISGTLKAGQDRVTSGVVVATSPELATTAHIPVDEGQFIDNQTSMQTATIGQQLAIDLFGEENPIGSTFRLRDQSFTVIGILKRQNNPVNYSGIDFDRSVMIHLTAGMKLNNDRPQIQQINILAQSSGVLADSLPTIDRVLLQAHGGERDFRVYAGEDIARPTNDLFSLLARVMTAIAAISLIVGGIGIMNIMLVSVAERTREIGIRKSVGASNTMILSQFLIESLAMSLMGGLVGVALGGLVALAISSFLFFIPVFSWTILGVAFGLSVLVGVAFGLYPALRAARKDPIESLRQYR